MENVSDDVSVFCAYTSVYSQVQEKLIQTEFKRTQRHHYLEHAGATLYSEKQLQNIFTELSQNVFANPHAGNLSSKLTEDIVDQVRYDILRHFGTNSEDYSVIFTSGATGALKILGEYFQYKGTLNDELKTGSLVYLRDNHTSVLGMREYAPKSVPVSQEQVSKSLNARSKSAIQNDDTRSLFVYPAQSNFSGTKYPLWWIDKIQKGALNGSCCLNSAKWFVALDAACFTSTSPLDLSVYKPDFVTISFYKMFGYPTGLGALIVKNSSADCLKKIYYGGGTVLMALSTEKVMVPRKVLHESFEDGTIPFLSIIALRHGYITLKRLDLSFATISQHTFALAKYVYRTLSTYHHYNGNPVAVIYHDTNFENADSQGGIVNFNLLRSTGEYIGYSEVLHVANLYGIHLRTGCSCNPGACQTHLKLTSDDVQHHFNQGHICGDQKDLIDGYPTGSVRISFGYMSSKKAADVLLNMIQDYFVAKPLSQKMPEFIKGKMCFKSRFFIYETESIEPSITKTDVDDYPVTEKYYNQPTINNNNCGTERGVFGKLENIFIYPVKSCAAMEISGSWKVIPTGLNFDRQWMIVNAAGVCFTQKHERLLCLIKPSINVEENLLVLSFPGYNDVFVPLACERRLEFTELPCHSKVCGDKIEAWDCGDKVAEWLNTVLGYNGLRLLKHGTYSKSRLSKTGAEQQLSLTNKAQFLLLNKASVQWLLDDLSDTDFEGGIDNLIHRFRPNFVVSFAEPLIEVHLREIRMGEVKFACEGSCTRCQMICIDQFTAEKTKEPLKSLSRKMNGKISFGIYLKESGSINEVEICTGYAVIAK